MTRERDDKPDRVKGKKTTGNEEVRGWGGHPVGLHRKGKFLFLRVNPGGSSVWILRFRHEGRQHKIKIANADFRCNRAAAEVKAKMMMNKIKEEGRSSIRQETGYLGSTATRDQLGGLMTHWSNNKLARGRWTQRHRDKTLARLERHLAPLWNVHLQDIRRRTLIEHLEESVAKLSVDTAGRVFNWVKDALEEAVNEGRLDTNPLGAKPAQFVIGKGKGYASFGSDLLQLRNLYHRIGMEKRARIVVLSGQILMLTGLRNAELRSVRIDDYRDWGFLIPRERMKIKDSKRGLYLRIPVSSTARPLVEEAIKISRYQGSAFVFASPQEGQEDKPIASEAISGMYKKLTNGNHTAHGNRTSIFSYAINAGYNFMAAKELLDHKKFNDVSDLYDRSDFFDVRQEILEEYGLLISGQKAISE